MRLGKKVNVINLKCLPAWEIPLSTICFGLWISHEWRAVYSLVGIGPEDSEKRRLCARHLHFGAVPKVQGWEEEACSLQWHFDLDSASWINPWTTTYSDAGAVHRIQSSHSVISGRQGPDCRCFKTEVWQILHECQLVWEAAIQLALSTWASL